MGFTILHLSDLHFRSPLPFDTQRVLADLVTDVRGVAERPGWGPPQLVVVSGDLAFSGKPDEYARASEWLTEVLEAARAGAETVVCVPGNHDVDRAAISRAFRPRIESCAAANALFESGRDLEYLGQKLTAYAGFLDHFVARDGHGYSTRRPYYVRCFGWQERSVGVAALNSALLCSDDSDLGRLVLSEVQIVEAVRELAAMAPDLWIAAVHHPPSFLASFDFEVVMPLLTRHFDLLLSGHLHGVDSWRLESPDGTIHHLAAGSQFAGRHWPNSYQWLRFDLASLSGELLLRRWFPEAGGRWSSHTGRFAGADVHGAVAIQLATQAAGEARAETAAAANDFGRVRDELLPLLEAERAAASAEQGYVPLKCGGDPAGEGDASDLESLLDAWLEDDDDEARIIFLLGDYGTGKSRFLEHYSGVLAERFLRTGKGRVPVRAVLRQRRLVGSLPGLLSFTLSDRYRLQIGPEKLKALMSSGRALLMLDGFDELPHEEGTAAVEDSLKELVGLDLPLGRVLVAGRSGSVLGSPEIRRLLGRGGGARVSPPPHEPGEPGPSTRTLYLRMFDRDQVARYIDRAPGVSTEHRTRVRELLGSNPELAVLARRPVVLELLTGSSALAEAGGRLKRVSELYELIISEWSTREKGRGGVESWERVLEGLARSVVSSGETEFGYELVRTMIVRHAGDFETIPERTASESLLSCLFLEITPRGTIQFRHRSFMEFLLARSLLRELREGRTPDLGSTLPSIETIDFLRELLDARAARESREILVRGQADDRLSVVLLVALREYPRGMRERLRSIVAEPGVAFGVRRVAAMSLAQDDPAAVEQLARDLRVSRIARQENLVFLHDLLKGDAAEIRRRTLVRLKGRENPRRPYWNAGRALHVATLGQVAWPEDIGVLEGFYDDASPAVRAAARSAVEMIEQRHSETARGLRARLELALTVAREAGAELMRRFRGDNPVVRRSRNDVTTRADVESEELILDAIEDSFADDRVVSEERSKRAPERPGPEDRDFRWIVDPLDGTVNHRHGLDYFAVALYIEARQGQSVSVIHRPATRQTYWAQSGQGAFLDDAPLRVSECLDDEALVVYATGSHGSEAMRRSAGRLFTGIVSDLGGMRLPGCSSLDFCGLAAGSYHGLIKQRSPVWDVLPGRLVAEEASATVLPVETERAEDAPLEHPLVVAAASERLARRLEDIVRGGSKEGP